MTGITLRLVHGAQASIGWRTNPEKSIEALIEVFGPKETLDPPPPPPPNSTSPTGSDNNTSTGITYHRDEHSEATIESSAPELQHSPEPLTDPDVADRPREPLSQLLGQNMRAYNALHGSCELVTVASKPHASPASLVIPVVIFAVLALILLNLGFRRLVKKQRKRSTLSETNKLLQSSQNDLRNQKQTTATAEKRVAELEKLMETQREDNQSDKKKFQEMQDHITGLQTTLSETDKLLKIAQSDLDGHNQTTAIAETRVAETEKLDAQAGRILELEADLLAKVSMVKGRDQELAKQKKTLENQKRFLGQKDVLIVEYREKSNNLRLPL